MADEIRVLHVDDDPKFTELTASYLTSEDEELILDTATTAPDALDLLADEEYDCVVSDYNMPEMDGIEFLSAVRERWPGLPFILFTGRGSEEVASDAIRKGATDYLQKGSGERYELLANRIRNAVEQYRATREAESLSRMRSLVNTVNQALVRATSRAEVERRVCEILAEADPYTMAWIGDVDDESGRFEARTSAGGGEDYLEDIDVSLTEEPTTTGPAARSVRERAIAVTQDISTADGFGDQREAALEHGYHSAASMPLEHEGHWYGVLVVYADRTDAFDEAERNLLNELGNDVAHAIHAQDVRADLELFRTLLDRMNDGVFVIDPETAAFIEVNEQACRRLGYDREELLGMTVPDVEGDVQTTEEFRRLVAQVQEQGSVLFSGTHVAKDNTEIPVEVRLTHVTVAGESYLVAIARDVTDRKSREEMLADLHDIATELPALETAVAVCQRTAEAADQLFDADVCVSCLEEDGVLVGRGMAPSEYADELPSLPVEEGLAGWSYRTGESAVVDDAEASDLASPQGQHLSGISIPIGDHGVFQALSRDTGAFDEADIELAELLVAYAERMLDRLEHEEHLARYETIIQALGDPVYALDADGHFTFVNDAYAATTGYAKSDLEGARADKVIPEEHFERGTDVIRDLLSSDDRRSDTWEMDLRTADGELIPCENHVALLPSDDGEFAGTAGIIRDVSERNRRERELRERRNTIERLHTAAAEVAAGESVDEVCARTVQAARDILEFDVAVVDMEKNGVLHKVASVGISDSDTQTFSVEEGLTGKTFRTGETFLVDDLKSEAAPEVANPVGPFRSLLSVPIGSHGIFQAAAEEPGVFDEADRNHVELLVAHTEAALARVKHNEELEARQAELERQNERLEEFASIVSHDLKNPLSVASGRLELLAEETDSEHLGPIDDALDRMDALIQDLLTLARQGETVSDLEPVDLRELADDCWQTVPTDEATLTVDTEGPVLADESRLRELLENLVRNAVEHGGTDVRITLGDLADDSGFYVADDGPGIPPAEREEVFEPGHSTAESGTGFGLAIVREVADAHGWRVDLVESDAGGARFEFRGVDTPAE